MRLRGVVLHLNEVTSIEGHDVIQDVSCPSDTVVVRIVSRSTSIDQQLGILLLAARGVLNGTGVDTVISSFTHTDPVPCTLEVGVVDGLPTVGTVFAPVSSTSVECTVCGHERTAIQEGDLHAGVASIGVAGMVLVCMASPGVSLEGDKVTTVEAPSQINLVHVPKPLVGVVGVIATTAVHQDPEIVLPPGRGVLNSGKTKPVVSRPLDTELTIAMDSQVSACAVEIMAVCTVLLPTPATTAVRAAVAGPHRYGCKAAQPASPSPDTTSPDTTSPDTASPYGAAASIHTAGLPHVNVHVHLNLSLQEVLDVTQNVPDLAHGFGRSTPTRAATATAPVIITFKLCGHLNTRGLLLQCVLNLRCCGVVGSLLHLSLRCNESGKQQKHGNCKCCRSS